MTARRRKLSTYEWTLKCERCSWEWKALGPEAPTRCAKCKAFNWNRPRLWEHPNPARRTAKKRR